MRIDKLMEKLNAKVVSFSTFDDLEEKKRIVFAHRMRVCDTKWMLDGIMDVFFYRVDKEEDNFIVKVETHVDKMIRTGAYYVIVGHLLEDLIDAFKTNYTTKACEVPKN